MAVTNGTLTLGTAGTELPVRAGELAYLPAGHTSTLRATEDAEVVVVTHGKPAW